MAENHATTAINDRSEEAAMEHTIPKTTAELVGDYLDGDDLVVVPRWALLAQRHPIGHPDRYASRERLCFEADNGPILFAEDGHLYAGERGGDSERLVTPWVRRGANSREAERG